jgi:hypothetical protein
MILRMDTLRAIERGEVTLAFRRWLRPSVKAGGRLRTAVGELEIRSVDVASPESLTERDARQAGFATRAELLGELSRREGTLYRIELRYAGEDARAVLREQTELTRAELEALQKRLARLDARGPWTRAVLQRIARSPGRRAADLARGFGMDTARFKQNVRKLKELGLTESLEVGYRLSPRGKVVLEVWGS